jgi:hypothetical protein
VSDMKLIMEGWHGYLAEADEGPDAGMTWGQLAQALDMVREMQEQELSAERKKELLKVMGQQAFNLAVSFTGPLAAMVKSAQTVGKVAGEMFKMYAQEPDPQTANNPFLAAMNLSDGFQDLIDDKLEDKFIAEILPQIEASAETSPNDPIPNMDEVIKQWIEKEKIGGIQGHQIEKPGE